MKTYMKILALLPTIFLLAACQGAPGRDGRDGKDGKDAAMQVVLINVNENMWDYSRGDNNNYYYATVDMPEITANVFNKGCVKMYRTFNFGQQDATQVEMPYVRVAEDVLSGGRKNFYTETVDYQFCVGSLSIFYTASDFLYEQNPDDCIPIDMQFRCVILF